MRIIIVGQAVSREEVARVIPGAITMSAVTYLDAANLLNAGADLLVTVVSLSALSSASGLTLAAQARARGIPVVVVDEDAEDGLVGAATMQPGGDLAAAVKTARRMRCESC